MMSYKIVFFSGFVFGIFPYTVKKVKSVFILTISYVGLTSTVVSILLVTVKFMYHGLKIHLINGISNVGLILYSVFLFYLFVRCFKTVYSLKHYKHYFEYFMNLSERSTSWNYEQLNMFVVFTLLFTLAKAGVYFKKGLFWKIDGTSDVFIFTVSYVDIILFIFVLSVVNHCFESLISDIAYDFSGGKLSICKIIRYRRRVTELTEFLSWTDRLFGKRNIFSLTLSVLTMAVCIFLLFTEIIGEPISEWEDFFVVFTSSLEHLYCLVLLSYECTKVYEKVT